MGRPSRSGFGTASQSYDGGAFVISHIVWDLGDTLNTRPPGGQDRRPLDTYLDITLRPGAEDVLSTCRQWGLVQAVLSDTAVTDTDAARRHLRRLGVEHYFSFVYATKSERDPSRPGKPDARVFGLVLDALGAIPSKAVMVGNTWDTDILGANKSGLHAIWLVNPDISSRRDRESPVFCPPWILPVWDLPDVLSAPRLLRASAV